ncbi:MAG: hypothetical protein ABI623_12440 [bacterium]
MKRYLGRNVLILLVTMLVTDCGYTLLKETDDASNTAEARMSKKLLEDEKKLEAGLHYILLLTESPDTTEMKRKTLERLMRGQEDEKGRLRVKIQMWGMSGFNSVLPELDSVGAVVQFDDQSSPFIYCWIQPKDLRRIIAIGSVQSIGFIYPGTLN